MQFGGLEQTPYDLTDYGDDCRCLGRSTCFVCVYNILFGGHHRLAVAPMPSVLSELDASRNWKSRYGNFKFRIDWSFVWIKYSSALSIGRLEKPYRLLELPHCRTLFNYTQGRHTSMILADNGHDLDFRARRIAANTRLPRHWS